MNMEVSDMTIEEKRDMLLEMLADLYTIKAANKEENAVLARLHLDKKGQTPP